MSKLEHAIDKTAHVIIGIVTGEAAYELDERVKENRAIVVAVKNELRAFLALCELQP